MELKKEKSCGCIIIKDNKVLLIHQKSGNGNFWGFPKGHMENGESEIETALREVKEEVGLDVEIDKEKRYILHYIVRDEISKTTVLYTAEPKNEEIIMQQSEIENTKWCEFNEALNMLEFKELKETLEKAIKDINN